MPGKVGAMRDLTDEEMAAQKAADKRQLDFDDLQREVTGQDGARMRRFLSPDDPRVMSAEKKAAKERAYRDMLDRLLLDPEYRALYSELGDRLGHAEAETDSAIAAIQQQLRVADQELADMEAAAAKGPDGGPVFRRADGRVVSAEGEELPPEIAAGIQWPANAPIAEDYFAAKRRRDDLDAHLDDLHIYRNDTLGGIRHRYEDRDDPMSKDDMRDALDDIQALRPELSRTVAPESKAPESPIASLTALELPMTLN